jgi:hypothetical protein
MDRFSLRQHEVSLEYLRGTHLVTSKDPYLQEHSALLLGSGYAR